MSNKKSTLAEKSLYDIHAYTDNELYDILDLASPTDRELEAKILMMIHKYEKTGTKSSQKLAIFFDDIYNHFFASEEEEEEVFEEEEDLIEGFDAKSYRFRNRKNLENTVVTRDDNQQPAAPIPDVPLSSPSSVNNNNMLSMVKIEN